MKTVLLGIAVFLATSAVASAQYGTRAPSGLYGSGSNPNSVYVAPSINSQGNSTPGHYRTAPNSTQMDNYGSRGNVNPYTGSVGTRAPRY